MRFRALSLLAAFGVVSLQACTPAPTPAPATGTPADEAAIRAIAPGYAAAFSKRDAKALAALATVDYEDLDAAGRHTQGRDAMEKSMTTDLAATPAGMTMTAGTTYVKWLSNTSAVAGGTYQVTPAMPGSSGKGTWMAVAVKKDSTWFMASSLAADAPPEMPAMPAKPAGKKKP